MGIPIPSTASCTYAPISNLADVDGHRLFKVCFCQPTMINLLTQILQSNRKDQFCSLGSGSYLVNDNLKLLVI